MSINNIAANANENTNAANPPKELSSEAHKYIKNIVGANTDLPISEIMEMLNQVYLGTSKEKKKNDLVKKYIDDINFITKSQENLAIFKNNKERVYLTYLKPDVKTKMYNAVKDEHLSPTLFAYYNCDRNRKVLSDKEAATMRAMKIDNNLDFTDENIAFNPFKGKKDKEANKDFDVISQSSFSHINFASASDPNTPYLRKKRQYSMKKKDPKKIGRSGKKSNTDKGDAFKNNRNGNDSDCEDEEDKEYCIHNCVFKRKYNGDNEMIGCDSCEKWYHPKCIGMSNEEVQNNIDIDWFCNECKSRKR